MCCWAYGYLAHKVWVKPKWPGLETSVLVTWQDPHVFWLCGCVWKLQTCNCPFGCQGMTAVTHECWEEIPRLGAVDLWLLESSHVKVEVLTLGAIIRSVLCPGKDQDWADVVLGYNNVQGKTRLLQNTNQQSMQITQRSFYYLLFTFYYIFGI